MENGTVFKQTSAKYSIGIKQLFETIAKKIVNQNYIDNSNLKKTQEEELSIKNRIEYLREKSFYSQRNKIKREENT